uniref:Secreted protein n=1 Tax=Picea sitchensis TaxID=3332 RepID=A0A6B9XUV5_PICSI|nr:hypothetical protein Q903MT_gene4048 [Picea sitchensis]
MAWSCVMLVMARAPFSYSCLWLVECTSFPTKKRRSAVLNDYGERSIDRNGNPFLLMKGSFHIRASGRLV